MNDVANFPEGNRAAFLRECDRKDNPIAQAVEKAADAFLHDLASAPRTRVRSGDLRFHPHMTLLAAHRCAVRAGYAGITTEEIGGHITVVPRPKLADDYVPAFLKKQAGPI